MKQPHTDDVDPETGFVHSSERMSERSYYPDPCDYLIYLCHIATYDFAAGLVSGDVLDLGCGTGYGTRRLAPATRSITGVDPSADAVTFASHHHTGVENLAFRTIEPLPARLPFDDDSFDSVVSFQVIEHVAEPGGFVSELHRVLRPGGVAIIATPDRSTRLFRWQRPWNEYHLLEFDDRGFAAALRTSFPTVEMLYMTADDGVDDIEYRRCRTLRLASAPFTFPHAPEAWRVGGLHLLKRAKGAVGSRGAADAEPTAQKDHGFTLDAVRIDQTPRPAMNLLAVVRKPAAHSTAS